MKFPALSLRLSLAVTVALLMTFIQATNAQNVLIIIADDLGADSLGTFSTATDIAPTPNLDALANNGVRFTRCWSNPTCSPSRASMLTGRHGFRTGVGQPGDPIDQDEITLAHAFSNAGYATACVGKWHLSDNSNGGADNPNIMGFDHFAGSLGGGVGNYFSWSKVTNGVTDPNPVTTYSTTENVNDAITWINNQNDKWFMWLAFNAPHTPFHLPPNDLHSYDHLDGNITNRNSTEYYQAAIEAMDTEIGRLLGAIDPQELANTTIIFVGDNGTPNRVSPGVVVGSKGSLYEGGVNVPCIVAGQAVAGQLNRTDDTMIQFVDVFETLMDIAQIDTPENTANDSISFAARLSDANAETQHRYQFSIKTDAKAIADNDYKYIAYDNGDEELFHRSDESDNLLDFALGDEAQAAYDELSAQMTSLVAGWTEISFDSFEGDWGSYTPSADSQLATQRRHASDGTHSAHIRNTSSFETTDGIDVSAYSQIEISFTFKLLRMEAGEGFYVEYFDGLQWHLVSGYSSDDFADSTQYERAILIDRVDYDFPTDAKFRFACDANQNRDNAYIDAVTVRAAE